MVKVIVLPEQSAFLTLWTCSNTNALLLVFTTQSLWVEVNTLMLLNADKLWCTFTNVIVDLVARGTGDQSLTDVTPCSIHTALIQLAGVRRQTLIYIWVFKKRKREKKWQMCQWEKKRVKVKTCVEKDTGWGGLQKADKQYKSTKHAVSWSMVCV